jgi:hypothetical protein
MSRRTGPVFTLYQFIGTSYRSLPNPSDICDQCEQTPGQTPRITEVTPFSRIARNMAPFRRIAERAGLQPLVIGLGLTGIYEADGEWRLGSRVYSQAVAYGDSRRQADALWRSID